MAPRQRKSTGGGTARRGGGGGRGGARGSYDFPLRDADGRISVIVEMAGTPGVSPVAAFSTARAIDLTGFDADEEFQPLPMHAGGAAGFMAGVAPRTYVVRGRVQDESAIEELRRRPEITGVWIDTPIAPFPTIADVQVQTESPAAGACPIPPCDCSPGTPHGNIADVANYLGASNMWSAGFRGTGIVVGVVDGGITAQGRPVQPGETSRRIPRVVDGWPAADWGTQASAWGEHGNMTSTDVLGMAPDANIYDLRISGAADIPSTISRALQAFQWAIDRHRTDGTPHVLSNSWGIFQQSWDPSYATDPNHPFTRKVVEAIGEGIIVLFAAGNCGDVCADGRCGPDVGSGHSIWGANSHPLVMTVAAVNKEEQYVGYSSVGPGALDPNKSDFCSVTHFTGYFTSDSGTSAATPILSGCVALIKQALPSATQASIKDALKATAKDIGPAGWDQWTGAGIVRVYDAYNRLRGPLVPFSRTAPCISVASPCASVTLTCRPSVLTPCISQTVACAPSVVTPCATLNVACNSVVCPSRACPSVAVPCQTLACPSLACGSIACAPPGPQPGPIGGQSEAWSGEGGFWSDPTTEWYGG